MVFEMLSKVNDCLMRYAPQVPLKNGIWNQIVNHRSQQLKSVWEGKWKTNTQNLCGNVLNELPTYNQIQFLHRPVHLGATDSLCTVRMPE